MIRDALVHVLVVTAEKRELRAFGESHGVGVRKRLAARRQQHDRRRRSDCLHCFEEWSGLHYHAGAAAIWSVIDCTMPVVRVVAQIHDVVFDPARRLRARRNAESERSREELRENRDDVDAKRHQSSKSPVPLFTTTMRPSESVRSTISARYGTSTLPFSVFTSSVRPCGSS